MEGRNDRGLIAFYGAVYDRMAEFARIFGPRRFLPLRTLTQSGRAPGRRRRV
jgi:hypothetical protein